MSFVVPPHSSQHSRRTHPLSVRRGSLPATTSRPLARILVSDDDQSIRAIYEALLADYGFESLSAPAGDGLATLDLAHRARPQLLITDVNKPGLDGHALRAALRASPATAGLPILIVSAMEPWSDRRLPPPGPLDDYLVKPFLDEALVYRAAALLPLEGDGHDRLVARARALPCREHYHPVTGLPCFHSVDRGLRAATSSPGWAALGVSLASFTALVRSLGRGSAEGQLARLGGAVASAGAGLLFGHTGLDTQIVIVGPAERVAVAAERLASSLAPLPGRAGQAWPTLQPPRLTVRHADDRAGLELDILALRAALRG